ncbi:esterase [Thalassotalea sp. 42_200_T64]|nr:esterase [Thalassotalea sp. 42_200_T64]
MPIVKHLIFVATLLSFSVSAQQPSTIFKSLENFGDNPGELTASYFSDNETNPNLVVLLHGCTQNGEQLAQQSGMLGLARQRGFALLLPQQSSNNNIQNCFNWFSSQDQQRDVGESLSLKNMITTLTSRTKAQRVYIAGISAGGAMASAMLVNYPDIFTAGAVIAGLPYPCANNLTKAISCMRTGPSQTAQQLANIVNHYPHIAESIDAKKSWPRLSVWTSSTDKVVNPRNGQHLAQQWAHLSEIAAVPVVSQRQNYQLSQWRNASEQVVIELIEIEGVGHGMAVNSELANGGVEAPFLLKSTVSTAVSIVDFWGLGERNGS